MKTESYSKGIVSLVFLLIAMASVIAFADESAEKTLADVRLDQGAFNPSDGQTLDLSYTLAESTQVEIRIFDPDGGLIRTLADDAAQAAGRVQHTWDGRDDSGKIVPDEAYTFVVETADGAVYDPDTFSGGEVDDLTDVGFDASGTVSYKLPAPARVLIRLGIHNGPMYCTLVDWKPRPAGKVNEYWDGFDRDQLVRLQDQEDFSALVTYATLPEATVITYGNRDETYREYKLGRGQGRPRKPERPRAPDAERRFRPDFLVPPAWAHAPRVTLTLPDFPRTDAVPKVKRTLSVRIDVAQEDKPRLIADQFEVLLFVDSRFFAEAERGYLPLNWKWELQQFPPGEHILTVNVSSFKGQVGVASRKILLEQ
ncbi:MAG: hypothetical protein LGR52_12670 [Candidatus Thiosymbion ectosymbiont of Robbea hypermnestra]|nr:hypothetical protein [Candidatus Thiosymbion ectosymbiont of Robbea hypermnestra]